MGYKVYYFAIDKFINNYADFFIDVNTMILIYIIYIRYFNQYVFLNYRSTYDLDEVCLFDKVQPWEMVLRNSVG